MGILVTLHLTEAALSPASDFQVAMADGLTQKRQDEHTHRLDLALALNADPKFPVAKPLNEVQALLAGFLRQRAFAQFVKQAVAVRAGLPPGGPSIAAFRA